MRDSMKTILAVLSVIVLAGAFYLILLAPKQEKVNELSERAGAISAEVASAQSELAAAEKAKSHFAPLYSKLTLIGKAVPSESGTASLVVQLQGIADRSETAFATIQLGGESGGAGESAEPEASAGSASLLPLGAAVGPAGLPAMSYTLKFGGSFFEIAKFIKELDALVKTGNEGVDADGRLVMIDGFTLEPNQEKGASGGTLAATFQVTTYVAPSNEGLTAGATAAGPETEGATAETTEVGSTP